MSQKIQRSVFIGLGGTGQQAVLNLKKKWIDVYGEVPPGCAFLSFDTDIAGSVTDRWGRPVELTTGEQVHLTLRDPRPLLGNPEVVDWWSPKMKARALGKGAGGFRQLGRLALFAHGPTVTNKIRSAIEKVRSWEVGGTEDKFDVVDTSVVVHVFGSLAGGTGAGTFIDVGMIAKSFCDGLDSVIAHLVLPDVFSNLPAVLNAERNAYASAQEIDMLLSMGTTDSYSYRLGGKTVEVNRNPFDIVFLVNNRNSSGTTYSRVEHITEFMGVGGFLAAGATGAGATSVFDNVQASAVNMPDPLMGKPRHFASYGLSELFFDRDRYAKLYEARIAQQLLNKLVFVGDAKDMHGEVRNFLLEHELVEEDSDQVLDAILLPNSFTKFQPPASPSPETLKGLMARHDSYLAQVDHELDAKASSSAAQLRQEKIASLNDFVSRKLSEEGGFAYARAFLEYIRGVFENSKEQLSLEREERQSQLKAFAAQHATLQRELEAANKAMLGGAVKRQKVAANIARTFMGEASLKAEIRRREEATAFFANMISEAARLLESLRGVSSIADVANEDLGRSIEGLRKGRTTKPFEMYLEPVGLSDVDLTVSVKDFLDWLSATGMSLSDLGALRPQQLIETLQHYASEQAIVKEMAANTIENVLSSMSDPDRMDILKRLIAMSAPLWSYSEGSVAGGQEPAQFRMMGYPGEKKVFSEAEVMSAGGDDSTRFVPTGDELRVFVYTAEAHLPAFVIDNFEKYRESYMLATQDDRARYHVNRTWIKSLTDLIPSVRSGESYVWALALSMAEVKAGESVASGSIGRNGNSYYYISRNYGDQIKGYEVKLGNGRISAFENFMDHPEYLAEVKDEFDAELKNRGNRAVASSVAVFRDKLAATPAPTSEDLVRQITQELEDLQSIVEDITTIK